MRILVPVEFQGQHGEVCTVVQFIKVFLLCVQTEAVKDMEAKLEEQEQNKLYLDQLLAMLKDRDPTLLHVINSSLASR